MFHALVIAVLILERRRRRPLTIVLPPNSRLTSNARLKAQTRPIQQYLYHQIASDTGHSVETIRELCFSIDGGHRGFTAFKSGMSAEQAMDAAARGE